MKLYTFLVLAIATIITNPLFAQESTTSEIFITLKKADSLVFEQGFNKCDFKTLENVMHKELQFYHDQSGAQNRDEFFKAFKESICANADEKPIRKLMDGSLIVYLLKNNGIVYGAVQMGVHEFYIAEPNKELRFTSNGKFIHTWLLDSGQWKLYKVISYDHQQPQKYDSKLEDNSPYPLFDTDNQIEALLQKHKIPSVSIGYIKKGKLQQIRAFGTQTPNVGIANNSIYNVASLTKPITAMVALKLIDAGKWNLDKPIANYYIDTTIKTSPYLYKLTTRHILSHQSGFPNWRYSNPTKTLEFEFEPGTKFQYSGEGFEYLRNAIETTFKKTLEQLATELIFTPLKMVDTHYYWTKMTDESRYAVESDTLGQPLYLEKYYTANAADNLLTTISDYSSFLTHISDSGCLSQDLYTQFITPQSTIKEGINYGLGMQVLPNLPNNEFALVHSGSDDGTKCMAILLPKSERGLLIFVNSENGLVIWRKIIEEYLGDAGKEIIRRFLN